MQRVVAIVIVLIFIMSVFFWINASAAGSAHAAAAAAAGCLACHTEEIASAETRWTVHAPFRDGDCGSCHVQEQDSIQEGATAGATVAEMPALAPTQVRAVDVHWIQECYEPSRHLILPVDGAEIQGTLMVEIWDQCRNEHQYAMTVPPLDQLKTVPPPGATSFILHEVVLQRDSRDSDTLVVRCSGSVPLRGRVYLHNKDMPVRVVESGPVYQTEINMSISGLKRDVSYSIYLEAVDASGTQQRSAVREFIPAQLSTRPVSALSAGIAPSGGCNLETEMALYSGTCAGAPCYLLAIDANQPITLSVGTIGSAVDKPTSLSGAGGLQVGEPASSARPDYHPDLADARFTNYSACRVCHPTFFGPLSHPVDIVPSVEMNVSAELHLLPDGRISCMTCHEVHAGDNRYRLRFKPRQKLCNSCHENY
ncbi:MAG: cytochrome c3 family protein [Desulfuromonas sp.]